MRDRDQLWHPRPVTGNDQLSALRGIPAEGKRKHEGVCGENVFVREKSMHGSEFSLYLSRVPGTCDGKMRLESSRSRP